MPETILPFTENFILKEELGRGAFSTVYRCIKLTTKEEYAAKVIRKDKTTKRDLQKLESEARICKKLNHPNIVKLYYVINEANLHYLIFDLVTGGELFDDLVSRVDNYTEELAASCLQQLLVTVDYIHKMGVVHRDLKPENILLQSKVNKIIKIADFGLAVELGENETKWFGLAGTPNYMAPEIIEMKPYGRPVDVWACGVIMYIMLAGYQPFYHVDKRRLNSQIVNGNYDLTSENWNNISEEAKDLIQKLLCIIPSRRKTAAEALKHNWFKIPSNIHHIDTVNRLAKFNAKRKFKAAVYTNIILNALLTARRKTKTSDTSYISSSTSSSTSSSEDTYAAGHSASKH